MACDIKTFALRQHSFLIPVLLIISLFNGIYSQTIPGNPTIVGDFEKNEGETATLSCTSVGGNPLPTVEWYKNNQLVDPGSSSTGNGDGVYTIGSTSVTYNNYTFQVSRSDNLVSYICRVKNSVLSNNLTRSWTISVYVQTQQPVITGPEPAITNALDAGSTYKYVCSASNGRPAPQILWKLGASLSTAVEFHQGISESTSTNADSTLTKTSNLSWVPITNDNGKNLYCETVQTTAGGSSTRKSTFVPINVQQTPLLQVGSAFYTTQVGGSVTLACTVLAANPAITDVYWSRLVNGVYTRISIDNIRFFGASTTNANLTINSVALSDATSYRCSATNAAGTGTSSATTLSVSGNVPSISITQTSYSVFVGSSVTLTCSVSGNPPVTSVFWTVTRNGVTQNVVTSGGSRFSNGNSNIPSLTLTNAQLGDSGTFICKAQNSAGTSESSGITLTVSGNVPSVSVAQLSYSVVMNGDVTMTCSVSANPAATIRWIFTANSGGTTTISTSTSKYTFSSSTSSSSLTVRTANSNDQGSYACSASNSVGTRQATTTLTVTGNYPSVNMQSTYSVITGSSINMICSVSANPVVTSITWQFQAASSNSFVSISSSSKYGISGTSGSSSTLTVNTAASSDQGLYRCLATNQVGTRSANTTLTVSGSQPAPNIPLGSYSVLIGNNIQIPCSVSADPPVTSVEWTFRSSSGSTVTISQSNTKYTLASGTSNPNLTINSAALTDAGTYTCRATNIVGPGEDSATLTITGNAATVTVSPPSQSVLQKSTAVISCRISNANPAITDVTWEKVSSGVTTSITVTGRFNGSTPSVPDLTISNLEPGDAGTYYCSARNAIGTTRSNTGSVLIVTGAVPSSVLIAGLSNRNVNLGGALTLQCSGQGQPSPTFTWLFSSSTTTSTVVGTGNTYTITNALRTNAGTYICRATNSLGTLDSPGVNVNVQYAPVDARTEAQKIVTATVDTAVTLNCNVDANPTASYQWYRNSQLVGSQQAYTFTFSGTDTRGVYTCRATNSIGSQDLQFTVSQGTGSVGASTASSGLSTGEIAAIILALLLLLLLIIIIIICCLTHGVCGAICGKKQDVKGRVEPTKEKEVYKETQKEVIIPRFHEESIKGKSYREPTRAGSYRSYPAHANKYRQPSAVSRKDVDVRVQNGGFRKENDYEIVRYETVPPVSTQLMTESPRPHRLPALSYTYEDVEKKRKRRKKKKHHRRRHHDHGEEVIIETTRSSRSPRRHRHEEEEDVIIERRSPSTKRRYEENYITDDRDIIQEDGDLRAYNGVVYREAPSRHGSGRYAVQSSERRSRSRGRHESDDDVEVVYGKEYVVER